MNNSIFKNDSEDFLKLFLPSLVVLPLIFLPQFEWIAWAGIVFMSVMDISHIFASVIEPYGDPVIARQRSTWILTAVGVSISAVIAFGFTSIAENIFFYSIVFHNMRQGLGVTLIYYKKSQRFSLTPGRIKAAYYFFTLMPIVIFHFERTYIDFGTLERFYHVVSVEKYLALPAHSLKSGVEAAQFAYWGLYGLVALFMAAKLDKRTLFSFLFFTGIYTFAYLGTGNLLFSTLLLMTSHAIPYLFLVHSRTRDFAASEFLQKYAIFAVFFTIIMGFCYYWFFYRHTGEAYQMSAWTKFFIITPSYIHYAFDGFMWTRGHPRFVQFLRGKPVANSL